MTLEIKETSFPTIESFTIKDNALIVGISIYNSYFKDENLTKLLKWSSSLAKSVYVMIPDEPMVHTMVALGFSLEKATKESRIKANNLQNKCVRIISELKLKNTKIIRWKDIKNNANYIKSKNQIQDFYKNNFTFRNSIQETTRNIILSKEVKGIVDNPVDIGVNFLFEELAFILYSDRILGEKNVAYVYHKTMGVMKDIINNKYSFYTKSGVNFITAE